MAAVTTLVNRPGAGYTYYFGMVDGLLPSFGADTITAAVLLVSDKLVVDSNWRESAPGSVLEQVATTLFDRQIAIETDFYEVVPRQYATTMLAFGLGMFIEWWARYNDFRPSEKAIEYAVSRPSEFLRDLRGVTDLGRGGEHIPYDLFRVLLDSIFTYACLGKACDRIFDSEGVLGFFMMLCEGQREHAPLEGTSTADWVVGICSELLPATPLYLDKAGNSTEAVAPWVDLGFQLPGNEPVDHAATMRRIEDVLSVRDTPECRDLRTLYSETVEYGRQHPESQHFIQSRYAFHKQWSHARALLRRKLGPATRLERWTDALTIPGAIASVAFPLIGAIPVLTWLGSKSEKYRAVAEARTATPWLALAEQMGDVGVRLAEACPALEPSE